MNFLFNIVMQTIGLQPTVSVSYTETHLGKKFSFVTSVFSPCFESSSLQKPYTFNIFSVHLMFIGPCIIAIVDKWETKLMSLALLFHLLCAQHVSDINISVFRSLRLCWWIATSVVLFSVRCVLEFLLRLVFGGVRFAGWSLQNEHHQMW